MRTLNASQTAAVSSAWRTEMVKVEVKDAGGTFRDLTSYGGYNFLDSVSWGESVDEPHMTADVMFVREIDGVSLSPLQDNSPMNSGFDHTASPEPLLDINRELKISVSVSAADNTVSPSWMLCFHGRIDTIDFGPDQITVQCRDLGGALADLFLEREWALAYVYDTGSPKGARVWEPSTTYAVGEYVIPTEAKRNGRSYKVTTGGVTGTAEPTWPTSGTVGSGAATLTHVGTVSTNQPLEDVLAAMLAAVGSSVTVYTPTTPSWNLKPWQQRREPLLESIRNLVGQIGWDIRYKWRPATSQFEFTLFDPDRTKTTPDATFGGDDYSSVNSARIDKAGIRNVVRVIYSDSALLDSAGNPTRRSLEASDSTSIARYGRLFCELSEDSNSQIDTSTEATTLANAVLTDLKDPDIDLEVDLSYGWPFVELGDLYRFSANDVHFTSDQDLAVFSYRHEARDGALFTKLAVRGKPSGGYRRWHRLISHPRNNQNHVLTLFNSGSAPSLTATPVIGGIGLRNAPSPIPLSQADQYAFHVDTNPGFTPSSTTLKSFGTMRETVVTDLEPGRTYYAQVVPFVRNADRLVAGQPSAEVSFTAGQGYAGHLNSEVIWGQVPLNGSFETQFDSSRPPDHWNLIAGTWNSDISIQTANSAVSGDKRMVFGSTGSAEIESAYFTIDRDSEYLFSFYSMNALVDVGTIEVSLEAYDYTKFYLGTSTVTLNAATEPLSTWVQQKLVVSTGSTTKYGKIRIERTADVALFAFDGFLVSRRLITPQQDFVAPTLLNSWVNYGSGYANAGYYKDSLGIVHLQGAIKNGTTTFGTTLFTLPAGYRPSAEIDFVALTSGPALASVKVNTSGNVTIVSTSSGFLSLHGISFRAA